VLDEFRPFKDDLKQLTETLVPSFEALTEVVDPAFVIWLARLMTPRARKHPRFCRMATLHSAQRRDGSK
jgi:hypothetical protein